MLLPRMAGLVENLMGLMRRQPLVPHVNRQPGQRAKFRCKGLRFFRLPALLAGQANRLAHNDAGNSKSPAQTGQRPQVFSRIAPPLQRQHWLRRKPQLIGDGNADASVANVQRQVARGLAFRLGNGFQSSLLGTA